MLCATVARNWSCPCLGLPCMCNSLIHSCPQAGDITSMGASPRHDIRPHWQALTPACEIILRLCRIPRVPTQGTISSLQASDPHAACTVCSRCPLLAAPVNKEGELRTHTAMATPGTDCAATYVAAPASVRRLQTFVLLLPILAGASLVSIRRVLPG